MPARACACIFIQRKDSPENVAADILDYIYPKGAPYSIPVISVTGTNGKTTVTRLIRHVLAISGKKVGMACSSGTYIGEECISSGDHTGPLSAQAILYNREVEVAVLETARGGIIRQGLGYDLADVGVIVNISEDHLGLGGSIPWKTWPSSNPGGRSDQAQRLCRVKR